MRNITFKDFLLLFVGVIYLLNFTLGTLELPDFLPLVGHIDEFVASWMVINVINKWRAVPVSETEVTIQ